MKKTLVLLAIGILVLLLVAALAGGSIIRVGLEKGAHYALGVDTKVGGASVNFLTGSVSVSDVEIGNPPGFKSKNAFEVSHVGVDAKISSLFGEPKVIRKIEVFSPALTLEQSASGTNLGALRDNLQGKFGSKKTDEKPQPPMKMRVDLVEIRAPRVTVGQSILGATGTSVSLPDITLKDLGTGPGEEITLAQLIDKILAAIGKSAASGVTGVPNDLAKVLSKETADSVIHTVEAAGHDLQKSIESATTQIGDIFKKKN